MKCIKRLVILAVIIGIIYAATLCANNTNAQEVEGGEFRLTTMFTDGEFRRAGVSACGSTAADGGTQNAATYIGYLCYSSFADILYLGYSEAADSNLPLAITISVFNAANKTVPYNNVGTYNLTRTLNRGNGYRQYVATNISVNPFSTGAYFKIEFYNGSTTTIPLLVHYAIPLANNQLVVTSGTITEQGAGLNPGTNCLKSGFKSTIVGSRTVEPIYANIIPEIYYQDCPNVCLLYTSPSPRD